MEEREFDRLLNVCRIKLSGDERAKTKKDVEEILGYFDTINKVDTGNVKDATHAIDVPEQTRADVPKEFGSPDLILKNTKTYRFYVVGPEV